MTTIAQRIVEIAEEIYEFGCAAEERGIDGHDDPVAVFTWAAPKGKPDTKRPLYEIRDDLVAVYQAKYDDVPNRQAVGDAMSVLEGRAKQARPNTLDDDLRARMADRRNMATELVELAREHYAFGVTVTGEVFAVPKDGPNIARSLRGGRKSLRADLAHRYFKSRGRAVGGNALSDALQVLIGDAQSLDPTDVALRVARLPEGRLVLDLGREDGSVVIVGPKG